MSDTGLVEERRLVEPVAVGPGDPAVNGAGRPHDQAQADAVAVDGAAGAEGGGALPAPVISGPDASLLALVDRLTAVLDRGDLGELEVSSGGTTIILRSPSAIERPVVIAPAPIAEAPAVDGAPAPGSAPAAGAAGSAPAPATSRPSVMAPLTGIYYGAPSPGATPYVAVGDHVSVGQIIGLIEAMKLFNEIKSDLAGRVVRICHDSGALVKAKQPLIEVEPA
ncbi:MAG: biotin/lipoyl-containing protein [Candidatus Limnocylindrales bacterium]